jgi:formylglycine-generating enzyme required for sulfatase activity
MAAAGADLSVAERIRRVAAAQTGDFMELVRIAGLDPALHFRFADWSGVDFRGCNLRGFDFTGARLHGARFDGARIARGLDRNDREAPAAIFDLAEIGAVCLDREPGSHHPAIVTPLANLRAAADWKEYVRGWKKAGRPPLREHLEPGAIFCDAPFAPEMVVVPAGSFWMGSPDGSGGDRGDVAEPERFPDEGPRHLVSVAKPFAVGRFAVTFDEWDWAQRHPDWRRHSGLEPRQPGDEGWGRGRRPVIGVSWDDAKAYCLWLAAATSKPYRLLSEAEWEYCCRAGTDTPFWWGASISTDQANYDGNFTYGGGREGEFRLRTVPVDSFEANPWGLCQAHGNVLEWCEDNWHEGYRGAPDDGSVWAGGDASLRVLRGGSWGSIPWYLRSADRDGAHPTNRGSDVGFRLARTL